MNIFKDKPYDIPYILNDKLSDIPINQMIYRYTNDINDKLFIFKDIRFIIGISVYLTEPPPAFTYLFSFSRNPDGGELSCHFVRKIQRLHGRCVEATEMI